MTCIILACSMSIRASAFTECSFALVFVIAGNALFAFMRSRCSELHSSLPAWLTGTNSFDHSVIRVDRSNT